MVLCLRALWPRHPFSLSSWASNGIWALEQWEASAWACLWSGGGTQVCSLLCWEAWNSAVSLPVYGLLWCWGGRHMEQILPYGSMNRRLRASHHSWLFCWKAYVCGIAGVGLTHLILF